MNIATEISKDLWDAVRRSYETQAWSNAILDGIHCLSDVIRSKTGLQSDGTALAGQALGGKSPKLRLNKLQTESEQNIQSGVENLLRGLYQSVRNPRSHGRLDDSQADADALLIFINYLLRVIGHARTSFSLEECVGRILEENFVPNDRYAELIIEEIPVRQRLQVLLTVYQRKSQSEGSKLQIFFQSMLAGLPTDEADELFAVISEELRETSDRATLKSILQILKPEQWPRITELARLRVENWLIQEIRSGRHDRETNQCLSGALATWSISFWPHFTLKTEVLYALIEKLDSSDSGSQDYVLQYFFSSIYRLDDEPSIYLQAVLARHLKKGDSRFKNAIDRAWLWRNARWNDAMTKALSEFAPSAYLEDDDLPF